MVKLGVFNATHMNQAVFAFRRYEDSSLSYTGIESHQGFAATASTTLMMEAVATGHDPRYD